MLPDSTIVLLNCIFSGLSFIHHGISDLSQSLNRSVTLWKIVHFHVHPSIQSRTSRVFIFSRCFFFFSSITPTAALWFVQCLANWSADVIALLHIHAKLHSPNWQIREQLCIFVHIYVYEQVSMYVCLCLFFKWFRRWSDISIVFLPSHEIRRHPAEADHDFPELWTSTVQAYEVSSTATGSMIAP